MHRLMWDKKSVWAKTLFPNVYFKTPYTGLTSKLRVQVRTSTVNLHTTMMEIRSKVDLSPSTEEVFINHPF